MPEDKTTGAQGLKPASAEQADALHKYAHDLKNRLAGLLEVVRQLEVSNEQRELLGFGEQQVYAMLRRTEQMLDELGVPRGPGALELVPVDLAAIVSTAIANQAYRYTNKQQILVRTGLEGALCRTDARQTLAAVEALLSNASKYSPIGASVSIDISSTSSACTVEVKDQGAGLTADDIGNIFSRYAWLSSRSTGGESQGRSTLAVCKRTVEAMGGTLNAQSEGPGKGCTFVLSLPQVH